MTQIPSTLQIIMGRSKNDFVMPISVADPNDLVGSTFLMPPKEYGKYFFAHIVQAIEDREQNNLAKDEDHICFLCSINDDQSKEIMSYNDQMCP
jgi:hypothetical protein